MMDIKSFTEKIEHIYEIIVKEENIQRSYNASKGFFKIKVSFEDIDLEKHLDPDMVSLIIPMQEFYKDNRIRQIRDKIFKVYIATLCEMAKRGFVGGINITIEEYTGCKFDLNRHYELLKSALNNELIKIRKEYGHHYEETIIYEAGIPRKFHKYSLHFFEIYWKWLKGVNQELRHRFLNNFLHEIALDDVYILDRIDYNNLTEIRNGMNVFKTKLFKTCLRLECVFVGLDSYDGEILESNISDVCETISENLGFNILTIVRVNNIQKYFLKYARKVGFIRFQSILNGLKNDEPIIIPDGVNVYKCQYTQERFICGTHCIKSISYDVLYPIGLTLDEVLNLQHDTVLQQGNHYIYISYESFDVEIDGYNRPIREFIHKKQNRYLYVGTIPAASIAYIDGKCITNERTLSVSAYIKKYWNSTTHENQLCLYLNEIKFADKKKAMTQVDIEFADTKITRYTNRNGYMPIVKERSIPLFESINPQICINVGDDQIYKQLYALEDLYIFSLQFGIHIKGEIDEANWLGDNRVVLFIKQEICKFDGIQLTLTNMYLDYYVYLGEIDFSSAKVMINEKEYFIRKSKNAYILLKPTYEIINDAVCYSLFENVDFQIKNIPFENFKDIILRVEHNGYYKTFNREKLHNEEISLKQLWAESDKLTGVWELEMFYEQKQVHKVSFVVIPQISLVYDERVYKSGETVAITVKAYANCFEIEGESTNTATVIAGVAELMHIGNLVTSKELEAEIYLAECRIYRKISMRPFVWDLQILNTSSQEWVSNRKIQLDIEQLNDFGLFICATRGFSAKIVANSEQVSKNVNPGYNKIWVGSIINNWKVINKICVSDEYGCVTQAEITYPPKFDTIIFEPKGEDLIAIISYNGPLDIPLRLCAFCDIERISNEVHTVRYNRCQFQLIINNIGRYEGKSIVVEGNFFDQDAMVLGKYFVKTHIENKVITIGDYCSLNALLYRKIEIEKIVDLKQYTNISNLLQ